MTSPHLPKTDGATTRIVAKKGNLKDVSVELPKRRLTVFTGVSGSDKSSRVFGTIAARSQREINETHAYVAGASSRTRQS